MYLASKAHCRSCLAFGSTKQAHLVDVVGMPWADWQWINGWGWRVGI